jgi:uncharacterized protein YecT (DUF1311 family)
MRLATPALAILTMVVTGPVAADDTIAAQADKCLSSPEGQTTAGMTECSHRAYIAYDKRMNEVYQRVLQSVDPKSRELIRQAQRRWLAFREAQRAADDGPWRADLGSMTSPDIEALNVEAVRNRIKELEYYAR